MTALNDDWLDRHIAHASEPEYNGEELQSRDYVWFAVAGAALPLAVSLIGWLFA